MHALRSYEYTCAVIFAEYSERTRSLAFTPSWRVAAPTLEEITEKPTFDRQAGDAGPHVAM
jgi:hypothetical protein